MVGDGLETANIEQGTLENPLNILSKIDKPHGKANQAQSDPTEDLSSGLPAGGLSILSEIDKPHGKANRAQSDPTEDLRSDLPAGSYGVHLYLLCSATESGAGPWKKHGFMLGSCLIILVQCLVLEAIVTEASHPR